MGRQSDTTGRDAAAPGASGSQGSRSGPEYPFIACGAARAGFPPRLVALTADGAVSPTRPGAMRRLLARVGLRVRDPDLNTHSSLAGAARSGPRGVRSQACRVDGGWRRQSDTTG